MREIDELRLELQAERDARRALEAVVGLLAMHAGIRGPLEDHIARMDEPGRSVAGVPTGACGQIVRRWEKAFGPAPG